MSAGHLALPWGIIKFLLQISIDNAETYGSLVVGLECVSRISIRYAEVEKSYVSNVVSSIATTLQKDLACALVRLYKVALKYLIAADAFFGQSRAKRHLNFLVPKTQSSPAELLEQVRTEEEDVHKVFLLVEAEGDYEFSFRRLVAQPFIDRRNRRLDPDFAAGLSASIRGVKIPKQEQRKLLLIWLKGVSTSDILQKAIKTRHNDTGSWIFERDVYRQWSADKEPFKASSRLLWIHGGPGTGKTVLCAAILERLALDKSQKLASFFCSSEVYDRRNLTAILRSWVSQLIQVDDKALRVTFEMYEASNIGQPPTTTELWKMLRLLTSLAPCTLVIDGFDECSGEDVTSKYDISNSKSNFLRQILESISGTETKFLLVSRVEDETKSAIDSLSSNKDLNLLEYSITSADTQPDILLWSRYIMNTKFVDRDDNLKEEIAIEAAEKSAGMFLRLALLGKEMHSGDSNYTLRKIVSDMPSGLENAYEREIKRILELKGYRKGQALAMLRWILYATRPLSVRELAEALIIASDETNSYPFDALPKAWNTDYVDEDYINATIIRYCGSLVELRKNNEDDSLALQTVHFCHASVREYLLSPQSNGDVLDIGLQDTIIQNDKLAHLCLKYLSFDTFNEAEKFKEPWRMTMFPFFFYAAKSWYNHAHVREQIPQSLEPDIRRLFDPKTNNWYLWAEAFEDRLVLSDDDDGSKQHSVSEEPSLTASTHYDRWDDPGYSDSDQEAVDSGKPHAMSEKPLSKALYGSTEKPMNELHQIARSPNSVYYAALLGLSDLIRHLKQQEVDFNTTGGEFGFPLQAAIEKNHFDIVDYLLEVSIESVNQSGGYYGSALGAAAAHGLASLVKQLLSMGARSDVTDPAEGNSPLHFACSLGEVKSAEVLLKNNQGLLTMRSKSGWSPFSLAVQSGTLELVKLLYRYGADVNDESQGYPVLSRATMGGHQEIARYLVRHRAQVDLRAEDKLTALHIAAFKGLEETARLLCSHHADLYATNNRQFTVMHFAVFGNSTTILKFLIEKGAEVDPRAWEGCTPLHGAAEISTPDIAEILLDHGADPNNMSSVLGTPLLSALRNRKYDTAKLLITRGANVTTSSSMTGDTALDLALDSNDQDLIGLLFDSIGFDEFGGQFKAITDPQEPGNSASNLPFDVYQSIRTSDIEGFLTRLNANVEYSQAALDSALLVSIALNSEDLARILLERGADPSCQIANGRTAAHFAAFLGMNPILELLHKSGGSVHKRDSAGYTPLHIACHRGLCCLGTIEFLLACGAFLDDPTESFTPPHADILQELTGRWDGEYKEIINGELMQQDATGMTIDLKEQGEIDPDPKQHLFSFRYEGSDVAGKFVILGCVVNPEGEIRFVKLYEPYGWFYGAKLEEAAELEESEAEKEVNVASGSSYLPLTGDKKKSSPPQLSLKGWWGFGPENRLGELDLRKVERT